MRHKLPDERLSITHKFSVGGHEGYLTVGLYKDGMPGELFITMAKEGSTVSGLMDSFACAVSIALQHGVPLRLLCEKFAHTRFEPSGWSHNQDIGYAKSIMDYIFRWLQLRFLTGQQQALFDGLRPKYINPPAAGVPDENAYGQKSFGDVIPPESDSGRAGLQASSPPSGLSSRPEHIGVEGPAVPGGATAHHHAADALRDLIDLGDAPSCHVCGAIMTRNGSCYRCMSCGKHEWVLVRNGQATSRNLRTRACSCMVRKLVKAFTHWIGEQVTYIAGRLVKGQTSSHIYDYFESKYVNFSGFVSRSSISIYDYDEGCYISESSTNLYYCGDGHHITLKVSPETAFHWI